MTGNDPIALKRSCWRLRRLWCALFGHAYERRDYIGDGSGFDSGVVFCRRCEHADLKVEL